LKRLVLGLISALAQLWRLLPQRLAHGLLMGLFMLESRSGKPAVGLVRLLKLKDKLDLVINERAMAYGDGEHPKHRLTNYHQFFIDRIASGERVLDVGCGYGAVARSIARQCPGARVVGVELDLQRYGQAVAGDNPQNLAFVHGDALVDLPQGAFDVVVLSNVLEHIDGRVAFLATLLAKTGATRVLVRVPLFERGWEMPLRRELGVSYVSDPDHKIEHRVSELMEEFREAGLAVEEMQTMWGEIWAVCKRDERLNGR
jgi:SAM-dependent methyltransferase